MSATRMKARMHSSFTGRRTYSSQSISQLGRSRDISRVNSSLQTPSENDPLLPPPSNTTNGNASQPSTTPKAKKVPWHESRYAIFRWPATVIFKIEQSLKSGASNDSTFIRWPALVAYKSWLILTSNYANVLLVFVPFGIISGLAGWDPSTVFILNFFAIIPLAALLAFATEELAAKLGHSIGGLLNATFGNAVELIVSIAALRQGQLRIVQSSMLGSILSNMLLVLGCCFIAGGIHKKEQKFDVTAASTMSSLMSVASASLVIPATLYSSLRQQHNPTKDSNRDILILSHGTAVILLILYVLYLCFQLYTHTELFDEETGDQPSTLDDSNGSPDNEDAVEDDEDEMQEGDTLNPIAATVALLTITVVVAICAEFLVDSIDSIVEEFGISKTFIGLILLPIVGNAAEHVTAVVVSYKNKMNLALGVAIGSSMQIALFVTPALVMLGWAIGQPLTLRFQTFETVVFFLSVLVVNYLIQDGKSNYLEGCMCIGTYTIIALAFYVYPDDKSAEGAGFGLRL